MWCEITKSYFIYQVTMDGMRQVGNLVLIVKEMDDNKFIEFKLRTKMRHLKMAKFWIGIIFKRIKTINVGIEKDFLILVILLVLRVISSVSKN